jgi:sugar lactone lactonase YvrE
MKIDLCQYFHRGCFVALAALLGLGSLCVSLSAQVQFVPALTTFAGTTSGYSGDGGLASAAKLAHPADAAFDKYGNMFIADAGNNVIREIAAGTGIITTVAGTGNPGYSGDGGPATSANLNYPTGVAVDSNGNIYIADTYNNLVRVVTSGIISRVAGTTTGLSATETQAQQTNTGSFTSGGVATSQTLNWPAALAIDSSNNVYIADTKVSAIAKVTVATGIITRYAGTGTSGYTGDGGAASAAKMNNPYGIAFDAQNNLYIADTKNYVIRFVNASTQNISTVAGTYSLIAGTYAGVAGEKPGGTVGSPNNGNGGPALTVLSSAGTAGTGIIVYAERLAIDRNGNLLVNDNNADQVRIINMTSPGVAGKIYALAGNWAASSSVGAAISSDLNGPLGMAVDAANNIYIADLSNNVMRKVSSGTNPPVVSSGVNSATPATLSDYAFLASPDTVSNLQTAGYFAIGSYSSANCPALYVGAASADGNVNNVAGALCSFPINFAPLTPGMSSAPLKVTDAGGNAYMVGLAGLGTSSAVTFAPGQVSTIAGTTAGYHGDSGAATAAQLDQPAASAMDSYGNIYIADTANHAIRKIAQGTGIVTTIAGTPGTPGYSGDGGPASAAALSSPSALALDAAGNILIADTGNHCIREISALTANISTIAGTCGTQSFAGDGGAATAAKLSSPAGVAVDSSGIIYIADTGNQRIREVVPATTVTTSTGTGNALGVGSTGVGSISTIAGTGTATTAGSYSGTSGDGGLALAATFNGPTALALDFNGNLFIADTQNSTVRKISATGNIISTVAGTGTSSYSGDGGSAASATLKTPNGIALDSAGNLYIADTGNNVIRMVLSNTGTISTLAGNGVPALAGDGSGALSASFDQPAGVTVDPSGKLYIADTGNSRLRLVDQTATALSFGTVNPGSSSIAQTAVVTNIGNAPLVFSSFSIPSPYTQQSSGGVDCSSSTTLAAGQSCNVQLVFQPSVAGNYPGAISITDNALNQPTATQTITISGVSDAVPTAFAIANLPGTVSAGSVQTLSVSAVSGTTPVASYTGTVHFTSTDPKTVLPADYTYTSADAGVHSFPVTFETAGSQSLTIADKANVNLSGAATTTVNAAAAASVTLLSGNNQVGQLQTALPIPPTVQIVDAYGNGVQGASVVFTAPATGASGTFSNGSTTITVTTDVNGNARASFTTNNVTGSYFITAASGSLAPVSFSIINSGALPTTLSLSLSPVVASLPYGQSLNLAAKVTPYTNAGNTATGTIAFYDTCCVTGATTLGTANIASGAAGFVDAVPITGGHSFSAFYSGDTNFAPSVLQTPIAFTVTQATVTLTGPATTPVVINGGQTGQIAVAIAGQFSGTNIVPPTGSLTYQIGTAAALTAPIALGTASIPIPNTLTSGNYSVTVTYPGDDNYQKASISVPLAIVAQSQTIAFNPIPTHTYGDQPISLSATASSGLAPTFKVISGPASVNGATLTITGAGAVVVAANQAGNAVYAAALQTTQSFTVNPAALTITAKNASRVFATANPAFTGTVSGAVNGDPFTESFTTTATVNSPVGTYPIVPSVTGTNLSDYTLSVVNGTLTVTAPPQTTPLASVTSNSNPSLDLSQVTFTATITGTTGTPTGTVTFLDGATPLGTDTLTAGTATLSTSALAVGAHSITVAYSGDLYFVAVSSGTLTETVVDINLGAATSGTSGSATQTVMPGGSAMYSLPIAPSSGSTFPAALTLTVSGLPAGATATIAPSAWVQATSSTWTLAPNTALSGNTQVVIQVPGLAASAQPERGKLLSRMAPLTLALLLLPFAGRMRRTGKRLGRMLPVLFLLAASITGMAVLSGCSSSSGFLAQGQKAYPVTVTVASGALSHSTTIVITVE